MEIDGHHIDFTIPEPKHGELTPETIAIIKKYVPSHAKSAEIHRTKPISLLFPDDNRATCLSISYAYGHNPHMNVGTHVGVDDNGAVEGTYTLEDLQQAWGAQ